MHAITGDLDIEMLAELDGAGKAQSEHWAFRREKGKTRVKATRLRAFGRKAQVEGLALAGDDAWYVHDDEKIRLEASSLRRMDLSA